jgi:ferredoxin
LDPKRKNKYIQAARRVSRFSPARQAVKKACKVDKALFRCSKCGALCYEGKSAKTFAEYQNKYPNAELRQEYLDIDHIKTVVPLTGWDDWNGFYERLECDESGLRGLCSTVCHKEKTEKERKHRWANKYGNSAEKAPKKGKKK